MSTENSNVEQRKLIRTINSKKTKHRQLKMNRCVVCGAERAGVTSYVYYESGRTRLYAPFCLQHLTKLDQYASPIFENQSALELFEKKFPQTYWEDVQGKTILFIDTYRNKKTEFYSDQEPRVKEC